jgi:hypothetical protein
MFWIDFRFRDLCEIENIRKECDGAIEIGDGHPNRDHRFDGTCDRGGRNLRGGRLRRPFGAVRRRRQGGSEGEDSA